MDLTLDPDTARQLDLLQIESNRPLIAVDADEVLVHFLRHFRDHVATRGWTLDLSTRRLDAALREDATGAVADREQAWGMLEAFFRSETQAQEPIPGAADILARLAEQAQIVVLTNIPHFARHDRALNLGGHGIPYPVLSNSGGKGRVLALLAKRAAAPAAFVDDSVNQIESAAKHAPHVHRLQLIGCDWARRWLPRTDAAQAHADDWAGAEDHLRRALAL